MTYSFLFPIFQNYLQCMRVIRKQECILSTGPTVYSTVPPTLDEDANKDCLCFQLDVWRRK